MYVPARYLICLDMILQDFCVRSKLSLKSFTKLSHATSFFTNSSNILHHLYIFV
jgi:hypothetical protein